MKGRLAAAAALACVLGCTHASTTPSVPSNVSAPLVTDAAPPRRSATILWPSTKDDGLVAREAEIFATRDPADQARQVLGLLLGAPPDEGVAAPLPAGTKLLSLFVDERGTAYVDLSREAASKPGGSAGEILAVNALCGTLVRSVPRIRRMQLLVDGHAIETLDGHLDLRTPVSFDESLLVP